MYIKIIDKIREDKNLRLLKYIINILVFFLLYKNIGNLDIQINLVLYDIFLIILFYYISFFCICIRSKFLLNSSNIFIRFEKIIYSYSSLLFYSIIHLIFGFLNFFYNSKKRLNIDNKILIANVLIIEKLITVIVKSVLFISCILIIVLDLNLSYLTLLVLINFILVYVFLKLMNYAIYENIKKVILINFTKNELFFKLISITTLIVFSFTMQHLIILKSVTGVENISNIQLFLIIIGVTTISSLPIFFNGWGIRELLYIKIFDQLYNITSDEVLFSSILIGLFAIILHFFNYLITQLFYKKF